MINFSIIWDWILIYLYPINLGTRNKMLNKYILYILNTYRLERIEEIPDNIEDAFNVVFIFENGVRISGWHMNRFYSWFSSGNISGVSKCTELYSYIRGDLEWQDVKLSSYVKWRLYKTIINSKKVGFKKLVSEDVLYLDITRKCMECRRSILDMAAQLKLLREKL